MTATRRALGDFGEKYARAHLVKSGYAILATNVRLASGEIDIVARDGDELVFVEVRTRRGDRFGSPEESVTPAKLERLANLGHEYVAAHGPIADWRIDVVALDVDRAGRVSRIEVLKNVGG